MATRAHSTRTPLLPRAGARSALLGQGSGKQPGPVTLALQAMQAANPDRIRALRKMIADRIEADIALLDCLDHEADEREADFVAHRYLPGVGVYSIGLTSDDEASLCGVSVDAPACHDDREQDDSDNEPSLASLGGTAEGCHGDQGWWSDGGLNDWEEQCEDEGASCESHDDDGLCEAHLQPLMMDGGAYAAESFGRRG